MTESAEVATAAAATPPPSAEMTAEQPVDVQPESDNAAAAVVCSSGSEDDGAESAPPSVSLTTLLAENAALRAKLQLSDAQRILEDVVEREVHAFLTAQRAQAPTWCSFPPITTSSSAAQEEEDMNENALVVHATSAALARMAEAKAAAEEALRALQADTVQPLQAQVERLCAEKEDMRDRLGALEAQLRLMTSESESGDGAAGVELQWLRQAEATLQGQLTALQGKGSELTAQLTEMLRRGVEASARLPQYEEQVAQLRAALDRAHTTHCVLEVQLAEQEMRGQFARELAAQQAADTMALHELHQAEWAVARREARTREAELRAERDVLQAQLAALQAAEQERLAAQAAAQSHTTHHGAEEGDEDENADDAQVAKRRRLEREVLDNADSLRGQCIRFRVEAGDTIARLERELSALRGKEDECRVLQSRLRRSERSAQSLTSQLTSLASEVHTLRAKLQQQRSHCSGLEAERDALRSTAATALQAVMSEAELKECAETLREAARSAATRRAEACVDPETMAQMTRQVHELRSEVGQLAWRKERLQRYVALREARVAALLEREVLLQMPQAASDESTTEAVQANTNSNDNNEEQQQHTATRASAPVRPFLCLTDVLDYVRECAQDVYRIAATAPGPDTAAAAGASMTAESATSNASPGTPLAAAAAAATEAGEDGHSAEAYEKSESTTMLTEAQGHAEQPTPQLTLRARLTATQRELLASQRRLQEVLGGWQEAQAALQELRSQHESLVRAHAEASEVSGALHTALSERLTATRAEKEALGADYAEMVRFAGQLMNVLSALTELLTQERDQSAALRQLVTDERQAMTQLLLRNAEMWGDGITEAANEASSSSNTNTTSAESTSGKKSNAIVKEVVEAIARLRQYMQDTIDHLARHSEEDKTRYVRQLAAAVRAQEQRIAELQEKYDAATAAQASALAQQLLDGQARWEQKWKEQCQAMEQAQTRQHTRQEVYTALQDQLSHLCSDIYVTQSNANTPHSNTHSCAIHGTANDDEEEVAEHTASVEQTLSAIRTFIAVAKTRMQRPQPAAAPASSNNSVVAPSPSPATDAQPAAPVIEAAAAPVVPPTTTEQPPQPVEVPQLVKEEEKAVEQQEGEEKEEAEEDNIAAEVAAQEVPSDEGGQGNLTESVAEEQQQPEATDEQQLEATEGEQQQPEAAEDEQQQPEATDEQQQLEEAEVEQQQLDTTDEQQQPEAEGEQQQPEANKEQQQPEAANDEN